MMTGYPTVPTDRGFAQRSARYLANRGYRPRQIRDALIEELGLPGKAADDILTTAL